MSDRRKVSRFALTNPARAQLLLAHDVIVELTSSEELTVLTTVSSVRGEEFALRLRAGDGRMATVAVCTRTSQPVWHDGAVRYRLNLQVLGTDSPAGERG